MEFDATRPPVVSYLSVDEALVYLAGYGWPMSRATLYRLMKVGAITSIRPATLRRRVFTMPQLDAWIAASVDSRCTEPAPGQVA